MLKSLALAFCVFGAVCAADGARAQTGPGSSQHDALIAGAKKAMMADPKTALDQAKAALAIAQAWPASSHRSEGMATSFWLESEALTRLGKIEDARAVLDRAIAIASNDGKTTKLDGDVQLSLARIADNDGDVALALKSYQGRTTSSPSSARRAASRLRSKASAASTTRRTRSTARSAITAALRRSIRKTPRWSFRQRTTPVTRCSSLGATTMRSRIFAMHWT